MATANKWAGISIIGIAVLLLLYALSYLALVQIEVRQTVVTGMPATWSMLTYRFGGDGVEQFFDPINQLDRRLRPKTWEAVNPPYSLMEDFEDLEPIEPVDE